MFGLTPSRGIYFHSPQCVQPLPQPQRLAEQVEKAKAVVAVEAARAGEMAMEVEEGAVVVQVTPYGRWRAPERWWTTRSDCLRVACMILTCMYNYAII
jgi:hypothetical protein